MKTLNIPMHTYLSTQVSPKYKLALLRSARGIWKKRKPDPIKELKQIRATWPK